MFNATYHFGIALLIWGGGGIIAFFWLGPGPGFCALVGVTVALFYGLRFFNQLEARDRRDAGKQRRE